VSKFILHGFAVVLSHFTVTPLIFNSRLFYKARQSFFVRYTSCNKPMSFASVLRQELAERALKFAQSDNLPYALSYGVMPVVCFAPDENQSVHGNFIRTSYKAIISKPIWRRRLTKVHTQARRWLPPAANGRWRELDSCMSSDALLMNIFCYPGVARAERVFAMLGVDSVSKPRFGHKARVPLINGRFDRTEIDMHLGNLLVEAKLTETDFQRAEKRVLMAYRDFLDVFHHEELPQTDSHYLCYQLLRNVLAAHAMHCSFCVLLDARRPDLIEGWYAVMKCVKPVELRGALRVLTWQELADVLPSRLRAFLDSKYGIGAHSQSSLALRKV